jgi:hypothetical protein
MRDVPENNPLLTAGIDVNQPAEFDAGGCFEPFIHEVMMPPARKPAPKPKPSSMALLIDKTLRDMGLTPTGGTPEAGLPASAAAGGKRDAESAQPSEILTASVDAPLPPPRLATAAELFTWIKRSILAQSHLPEPVGSLLAFWAISTWFQDSLTVVPILVISGPSHDATLVLQILNDFCLVPVLLTGFQRSDLIALSRKINTLLISEPNLDKRTAALLGDLTNRGFAIVDEGFLVGCVGSRAINIGEDPAIRRIQHAIYVNITPTDAEPLSPPQWLQQNIKNLPRHLKQYREKNLDHVRRLEFSPSGVSSETAVIAKALGSCLVDAPNLQEQLVDLLKAQHQQNLSQKSATAEAVVIEAALALSRHCKEHAYVREIADEVNRLLENRGEGMKMSPEKVGHRLRKLGLPTRRLSKAGNGLIWDKPTIAALQQLGAMYVGEDLIAGTENLHCSQVTENNKVEDVM